MIPKTAFLEVLEDIHKRTDMRYGQIVNNALQVRFGRKDCDCKKGDGCKCANSVGAAYDTFYIWDKDLTDILDDYHASLFPDEKPVRKKPKVPPGTISEAEWKRLDKISDKMAAEWKKRKARPASKIPGSLRL